MTRRRTAMWLLFLCSVQATTLAQDFVFPDQVHKIVNNTMKNEQTNDSTKCSINMTLVDDDGEIVCECARGYLYYFALDSCFQPYHQGPCPSGSFLALPPNESVAKCLHNPCEDGSISYQSACHKLLQPGPPCPGEQALIVNEINFEINCQEVGIAVYQIISAPSSRCSRGSRRIARGRCRPVL